MTSLLKTLTLSIALAAGFGASSASADKLVGGQGNFVIKNGQHPCGPSDAPGRCRPPSGHGQWGQGDWPRHHGWNVHPGIGFGLYFGNVHPRHVIRPARFCTNGMAINKAASMGIHKIRAYSYRSHVLIKGIKRGQRIQVSFAREYGCPTIRY
jgi:hypothetical protein